MMPHHEDTDSRCSECQCNVDDPATPMQKPCAATVFDPGVICTACCIATEEPCASCATIIPASPNHTQSTWTATGLAGKPFAAFEVEPCDECGHTYNENLLTPVRLLGGSSLMCPRCIDDLRLLEASA
jgi:hypothetical protein